MSSDFFVTKLRFFYFSLFFISDRKKNKVLCTNSETKFFTYAQHKQKVAQLEALIFR